VKNVQRREELSSRERVRLALQHQVTDRIPIAMICSGLNPPVDSALDQLLRTRCGINLERYLHDIKDVLPIGPNYIGPPLARGEDIWGVRRKAHSFGLGAYDEIVHYPLAGAKSVEDVLAYRWPDVDWFDYEGFGRRLDRARDDKDWCLMISNGNIFESAWYMRGFERAFMDFIDQPEMIYAILEQVADFQIRYFRRQLEVAAGRVDLAFTADDIGGQNGLLMSLSTWEKFIQPFHARLNQTIHEFGVKVIYHTDGAVMKAVPGLINMGIDILQALQFSAKGMDPVALKAMFGDQLCFEGGVSVQTTLPFGTVDEVIEETRSRIKVLGKGGGYILGPSHAVQAGTPAENVLAMFETARDEPL
jgi:uroporphyrinogen decarboxylase